MISILFNIKLYPLKSIKEGVKMYGGLCRFSLKRNKKYIQVMLYDIEDEIKSVVKDEFCNYVLSLVKKV